MPGACEAVEHLIRLQHRRIGCIGWVECTAVEDRLQGYRLALGRHGIPYDETLVRGILDEQRQNICGGRTGQRRLSGDEETLAIGPAARARFSRSAIAWPWARCGRLREAGLQVPDDVALVGFDDVRYAADLDLTTVAQPAFETGKTAAEILIGEIERGGRDGSGERFQQVVLPTRLIVRGSCGGKNRDHTNIAQTA